MIEKVGGAGDTLVRDTTGCKSWARCRYIR